MNKGGSELWVVGDVHFAMNWDKLGKLFRKNHIFQYLNPNKELRGIIKNINGRKNVLALILNGDSINQVFANYLQFWNFFNKNIDKGRPNNFDYLYAELKRLKKPFFQVPGNHDYRKEAYTYRAWNRLLGVNISDKIRKKYADKIGRSKSRLFFELNDITVDEGSFNPLKKFKGFKKATFKKIGEYECVFLNTGSDAFVRSRNWWRYFTKLILRGKFGLHSDGIFEKDLQFLKKQLEKKTKKTLYVFMHAPLINSRKHKPGKIYLLDSENLRKSLIKNNLVEETIFNGLERFSKLLLNSSRNVVIVSSHVHNPKYFLMNRKTMEVEEVNLKDLNRKRNDSNYVKQVVTLAMGAIPWHNSDKRTGFLKITPSGFKEEVLHKFKYIGD